MSRMLDLARSKDVHIDERLRSDLIVWLGTVRPDGRPHMVPVWFLWDGESVLIFSKPGQKVRNIGKNRNVMLALDNTNNGSDVVLFEGEATLLPEGEVDTTLEGYASKYAGLLDAFGWSPQSMAMEYTEAIRVRPTRFLFYR